MTGAFPGDVATNIAEDVIYLETAELVRHG